MKIRQEPVDMAQRFAVSLGKGLLIACALSSCTWVELSEDAAKVAVVETRPDGCALVGTTTATSRASLAGVQRNAEKFKLELETLAKNEAVRLGASVVVPGEISGDQQIFTAYRCP